MSTDLIDTEFEIGTKSPNSFARPGIVAIDDDPMTLHLLSAQLKKSNFRFETASDAAQGLRLIDENTAVALVDLQMPGLSGFDCLEFIKENWPHVRTIILTGSDETSDAFDAIHAGAFQYLTKPFNRKQLDVYIHKGFAAWRELEEKSQLKQLHSQNVPVREADGQSSMNVELGKRIARLSELDSTIFVGGESGTGKSTIARLIHQKSRRSRGPFITVNCAALPRDLLQSELFGHTRGAFTGAVSDRAGHAEAADGGTLFLDEIGDLPLELQPKLLTFLQDRTVQRIGSTESKKVDVRLIVATHRDLAEMVDNKEFRQDLFFRLMVLGLEIEPLRNRRNEIAPIGRSILERICERMDIPSKYLSKSAVDVLESHTWPGNIRELENVLERATAFSTTEEIRAEDLVISSVSLDRRTRPMLKPGTESTPQIETNLDSIAEHVSNALGEESPTTANKTTRVDNSLAGMTLEQIEREAIRQTLIRCEGNKAKSARMLGISEKSIYNKMKRLKLSWPFDSAAMIDHA